MFFNHKQPVTLISFEMEEGNIQNEDDSINLSEIKTNPNVVDSNSDLDDYLTILEK